ncbi:MAG: hypothetical protein RL701_5225 [Pseudomonadota bacterium]
MFDQNPSVIQENEAPAAPDPSARTKWTALLRDALRGVEVDLTTLPVASGLVILAVPMILEMIMESVFAIVDVFWVAHLGATAVATVGLTESMMMIIYSVAMGMSIGAMALVARRIGEKERDAASRTAVQSIMLGVFFAVVIGLIGGVFAPDLLRIMGADAAVIEKGSLFTRIMLGGNVTVFALFLINAIFRGAGAAVFAMRVLWLGNGLNIVLGPLFIFGWGPFPELGVAGAAVATNIGRGSAVLYQLYLLTRGRSQIKIARKHLTLDLGVMWTVLTLSVSATVQMLISMTSYIGVMRILSKFGSEPLAGYTIGFRILMFAILPAFGLSNAAATLVGQNLGAKRPDRAEEAAWRACYLSAAFLSCLGLIFWLAAPVMVGRFTSDATVLGYGVEYLRISSLGFPFYAFGMVLSQSFNGAGDTRTPTLINIGVFWVLQMPLAWVLSQTAGLGPRGVFITLAVCFSMFAAVSFVLFRRGRWKTVQV